MPDFNPSASKSKAAWKISGKLLSLCADAQRNRLYAGDTEYAIQVFDPAAEKKEPLAKWAKHENYVSALAFAETADGPRVISGSYDRKLVWWDPEKGEPVREVAAHDGWIRDLVSLGDGKRLASCGDDMQVKIWDATSGELLQKLAGHALRTPQDHVTALYALAVSPDGKHLASGDRIGEVRVWNVDSGDLVQSLQTPVLYTYDPRQRKRSIGGIRSLAFSPDGARLAVGGIGQIENVDGLAGPATVEVWDWQAKQQVFATGCEKHKALVNALAFTPDGQWLLGVGGGGDNGLVAWWKNDTPSEEQRKEKKDDPVPLHRFKTEGHWHRLLLDPERAQFIVAGHQKLEVWEAAS